MVSTYQRVAAYIDGFNLYYGLRSKGWQRYYWLDLNLLVGKFLRPAEQLEVVRYFTTRVSAPPNDPDKPKRQNVYLEALETLSNLTIQFGYFLPKQTTCNRCGLVQRSYQEKMTDVNIAISLLADAQDGIYDTAIIISADSDLATPIERVLQRYPSKRVLVAFPPDRASQQLRKVATAHFTIGRTALRDSQLPNSVTKPDGFVLTRPSTWN